MGFLDIILIVFAVILIILSLLQSGKSDGLSSAFTGGDGLNLFANVKERGAEKTLSNLTMAVGIIFFVLVLIARVI
ncbi:MAG: preprotein translocase subunit SecG [Erysipelotrichaceae bacterium]|nr:preprotein translocase subunit SecG [Erysipelotrichaceae bacterium]MCI9313133.1 preprotein translocase subunit SecG [Erysipelotrichaceae bacterium]